MQSSAKRGAVLLMALSGGAWSLILKIVWGQEQYLGAHRRGQDGRRKSCVPSDKNLYDLPQVQNNFESMCGSSDQCRTS